MDAADTERRLDRLRFGRCWRACGARDESAFEVLAARYAEPHRTYHTAEHIAECLAWLDCGSGAAERLEELKVAIYFHDIVYEPTAGANERQSAALFRRLARRAGIGDAVADRVAQLIESTTDHVAEHGDAVLLGDIDLAVLGASPSRFARFEADIRREYGALDDSTYRAGRAAVLRAFLSRIEIYRTPLFAQRLEAQARDNLSRALVALESQA